MGKPSWSSQWNTGIGRNQSKSGHGNDDLRGYLEQRLGSIEGIKRICIKRPAEDTPWAAQEPTPKMDPESRVFTLV